MNTITLKVNIENGGEFTVRDVETSNGVPYIIAVALVNYAIKSGVITKSGQRKVDGQRGKPQNTFAVVKSGSKSKKIVAKINDNVVDVVPAETSVVADVPADVPTEVPATETVEVN